MVVIRFNLRYDAFVVQLLRFHYKGVKTMDADGFNNKEYLHVHYAGQAMVGLLANSGLNDSLSRDQEVSKEGADRLATLACNIGEAMVREVEKRYTQ